MKREIIICDTCGKEIHSGHDRLGAKHSGGKDYHAECIPQSSEIALEYLANAILLEEEPKISTSGNMKHYDYLQQIKDAGNLSHQAVWAVNYLQTRYPRRIT